MYIWVVLATFLAILASYTLPVRPDMHQLESQPLAEAELNKLYVKHQSAIKFAKNEISRDGNGTVTEVNYEQNDNRLDNDSGNEANKYSPEGFVWNNGYTSTIVCLNEDGDYGYSCNTTGKHYVVTYGNLPQRWINKETNLINAEFERVISKSFAKNKECGLIIESDECDSSVSKYDYKDGKKECIDISILDALYDYTQDDPAIVCMTKIYDSSEEDS